ncbi:hypothetical protein, partial [Nocardioides dubius]|uniref:hypothetical protein n=1 Tax=Nocardioides dubius TaxID=317019 RepID=UPI0031D16A5A
PQQTQAETRAAAQTIATQRAPEPAPVAPAFRLAPPQPRSPPKTTRSRARAVAGRSCSWSHS